MTTTPLPSNANSVPSAPSNTNNTSPAPPPVKPPSRCNCWLIRSCKAYGGSLLGASVALPIVGSAVTVCIYLAPPFSLWLLPSAPQMSNWYAPVYSFFISCIALLVFAAFYCHFATAKGANAHVYGLLTNHYDSLKARLGEPDEIYSSLSKEVLEAFKNIQSEYGLSQLRRAHQAYYKLDQSLFHDDVGIPWVFGTAYTNAWDSIHRAQEALVAIETPGEVVSDVIHDVRSIQSSALNNQDDMIRKLLQAVKDLQPEAMVYFSDLESDKKFADLFPKKPADQSGQPNVTPQVMQPDAARQVIQQVKHSLNRYQDNLRSELVRARNYLSASIAFTGVVTHLLLCIVILLDNSPGTHSAIIGATAYYMIGTVAGLFGRFYNEANSNNVPDDYGLFLSRLVATPLLSGLAAIGGVIITATLGDGHNAATLGQIFNGTLTMEYLIAAAVFGSAPNLILTSFQQKTQKYATDLQNSKGEGNNKGN